jgi:D-glycero-D-manno-heptose 1,7-bisphosphate phosphatase
VSNQPAAAKDKITVERLCAIHARVIELLALAGAHLRASRLCLHHPEGVVAELSGPCDCRKPAPGMLRGAASALNLDLGASWMIGDTDADIGAGSAAGCRTVLIEHPGTRHKRSGDAIADVVALDLNDAVMQLLGA